MLIVTPNLCFDVTVRLPRLTPGTIGRATQTVTTAGGKGVNVARAARDLAGRERIRLAGFLPTTDGARLAAMLADEGTALLPVAVPGPTRVASILIEDDGRVTVINGRGPDVSPAAWHEFGDLVRSAIGPEDVLVCSGSLPPGVPTDAYGALVEIAHAAGRSAIVDAAPAALRAALPFRPDLVSPNLAEAEGLLHGRGDEQVHESGPDVPERAAAAAEALHRAGAGRAVVTAGAAGAALSTAEGNWWIPSETVDVVNPIGAGDAFVAGAALALAAGADDVDIVRRGMATASASCEQPMAGRVDRARVAELLDLARGRGIPDRVVRA